MACRKCEAANRAGLASFATHKHRGLVVRTAEGHRLPGLSLPPERLAAAIDALIEAAK